MNIKRVLAGKRGETLMEGIISILIFTIMMATITMMISWAMRLNATAMERGTAAQAAANSLFAGTGTTVPATLTLRLTGASDTTVEIPISTITDADDQFFAFFPR
jgi:predicted lipid-binding transport protein (Tim44 family)